MDVTGDIDRFYAFHVSILPFITILLVGNTCSWFSGMG